ncbi:hypothetical protein BAUCODRAFT_73491 [Baudoinia panamericana UAMH 10762]|uniref:Serine aminopeptidase S33 domain-containing protein n=1 Tax=Baudoinia panamericana (strain UAMH 10762) TaxID=717646 RepID=M2N6S6_BAUPA|nr:uncharacterized protein BAUCODRAFT_73491 [Baudoinia panamericana UAMH 10762]EMC94480.1 hypothetical protein BAUCODRAFT_73491 [Baudoinia panamericana UAMH 10762]
MEAVATEEGWLTTPDNAKLYTKHWRSNTAQPRARLVFIHGFSDHCNFYGILFPSLACQGVIVHSFDQRGWGRSVHDPAQKGRSGPTKQVLEDITTFINSLPTADASVPLFLMGHSMGGAEVLHYAAAGPRDIVSSIRGFLVESPFIALSPAARPWTGTVVLGRMAARVLPHQQMVQKLDAKKTCRDPDVCKQFDNDPLCHDTGTLEGLAGMLDRALALEEGNVTLTEGLGDGGKTRLWLGHGSGDAICDFNASRKWFESVAIEDKEMRVYEGWYHKLHAEPGEDKVRFANDVAKWILDHSEPSRGADGADQRAKL